MSIVGTRTFLFAAGFVLTVASGVGLSNGGRPLNSALFTLHKLVAVGTIILTGTVIYRLSRVGEFSGAALAVLVIAGLLFATLLVSGALLRFDTLTTPFILRLHQVAPWLALPFALGSLYLLEGGEALSRTGFLE